MTSATALLFVVLTASVFYLNSVHAASFGDLNPFEESVSNATLTRNSRQVAEGIGIGIEAGKAIAGGVNAALDSPSCTRFGCSKGYCWAYCHAVLGREREWCYTSKGRSQDYNYVKCSSDSDCNGCWKCAGSCAIGF